MLVDSGATDNFIALKLVRELALPLSETDGIILVRDHQFMALRFANMLFCLWEQSLLSKIFYLLIWVRWILFSGFSRLLR